MIQKEKILEIVSEQLDDNDFFIVDISVATGERITIYIDRYSKNISLDDCQWLHRKIYPFIEELYDNFDLTVSSPGLTSNLKVWQQYYKHIGEELDIQTTDEQIFKGKIINANNQFVTISVKGDNKQIPYSQIKKAKLILKF